MVNITYSMKLATVGLIQQLLTLYGNTLCALVKEEPAPT